MQVSQVKLIERNQKLTAAGRQAEKAAAAKVAACESAYDELYSTARKGLLAAGRNVLAATDGAKLLYKAMSNVSRDPCTHCDPDIPCLVE